MGPKDRIVVVSQDCHFLYHHSLVFISIHEWEYLMISSIKLTDTNLKYHCEQIVSIGADSNGKVHFVGYGLLLTLHQIMVVIQS